MSNTVPSHHFDADYLRDVEGGDPDQVLDLVQQCINFLDSQEVSVAIEPARQAVCEAFTRWFFDLPSHTRTFRLQDAPGALLTTTCPSWCTDPHAEETRYGVHAPDFTHRGDELALPVELDGGGTEDVLVVQIHQSPFGYDLRTPVAIMWPSMGMTEVQLDPDRLAGFAGQLRDYAREVERLCVQLEAALVEHGGDVTTSQREATDADTAECGARKPGWEHGPAVGRHRIPCTLPTGHEGAHRDGLGQTWAAGGAR